MSGRSAVASIMLVCGSLPASLAASAADAQTDSVEQTAASEQAVQTGANVAIAGATAEPQGSPVGASLEQYHAALAEQRLGNSGPLSVEDLRKVVEGAEAQMAMGRRDEAIGALAALIASPRFVPLRTLEEGRAAVFFLGDGLGRAGAYGAGGMHLESLLGGAKVDSWYRRAVSRLVDFAIESGQPQAFLRKVSALPGGETQPWAGDVAFIEGLVQEQAGSPEQALAAYARVTERSRFWAQATYRSGLLEVERSRLDEGERLFCNVADPERTPRLAPLFGGNDFFKVRDLSRLALGRVAHEQYRFDDARYYYHLVPGDSEQLPEALYESATSRYEAKDYESAHTLLGELRLLERGHPYEDEAWLLDAYVDLAQCEFPRADAKLREFLARYEPVLEATRQLQADSASVQTLLGGQAEGATQEGTSVGIPASIAALLSSLVRVDSDYGEVTRQIANIDHQLSGLRGAASELRDVSARLVDPAVVKPRPGEPLVDTQAERLSRLGEQTAAVRRLLREAGHAGSAGGEELTAIKADLIAVEAEAAALQAAVVDRGRSARLPDGDSINGLLLRDADQALDLEAEALKLRADLVARQTAIAGQSLARLERRLTRLVRRARAGRIETVLGRKRAVEVEIEALSQGYLPQGAIDSLDAARYLQDSEEYWPFDGEDWEDEYIGGEGLR